MKKNIYALITSLVFSPSTFAIELTIESWRSDDLLIWKNEILPRFMAVNPGITISFNPTAATEYDSALSARLEGGAAGDLITCRPFDRALDLYKKGYLSPLNDLNGLEHFEDVARSGWSTDDDSTIFCVPMASVIHGFMYNKDIFEELNLSVPKTETEFFEVLSVVKEESGYSALAMGTYDQWEAATMGFNNIGPNYWQGEEGRKALISGTARLSDPPFVAAMQVLSNWSEFLPRGFEAITYSDAQNLFSLGRAAIYPTGSWEISGFSSNAGFEFGAFRPPVANEGDTCFISDHVDIGIGMNAATDHPEAAKLFLEWVTTAEFAQLYSNALPGFFSLSNHSVELENEVAQSFVSWREECQSTIRLADQILSRGIPSLSTQLWGASARVINGLESADSVIAELEEELDAWYKPN